MRINLIQDGAGDLFWIEQALAGLEVRYHTAAYPVRPATLDSLQSQPAADLIILDWDPAEAAQSLFVAIRSTPELRWIKVVIFASTRLEVDRALMLGAWACLLKPVNREEFDDVLARAADRPASGPQ